VNVPPALSAGVNDSILRGLAFVVTGGVGSCRAHLPFVDVVGVPRLILLVRGRHLEFRSGDVQASGSCEV
jgi:hypothetical protein